MSDRQDTSRAAADALRKLADRRGRTPVVIGFDGFVDSIIDVVDKRQDIDHYEPVATIEQLGKKFVRAAGQSSNYELVVKLEKLGGNGPIMAEAMARAGLPTTYVGALGHPARHPAFDALAEHADCISFSDPGFTDALEFSDGKIMLGKHAALNGVNAEQLDAVVGADRLREVIGKCRLLGMVNWTMLGNMNSIWQYLIDRILPGLPDPDGGKRTIFIDLTDPEKRTAEDLRAALRTAAGFKQYADVILGLNLKEAVQVAGALELLTPEWREGPEPAIEAMAVAIREKLDLTTVVIHPRRGAAGARQSDGGIETASFVGPMVQQPRLSTGAGDNFNAGYCLGHLAGLPLEQSLCVGTATSGYYVRHAGSPTLDQLATFCDDLPEPE